MFVCTMIFGLRTIDEFVCTKIFRFKNDWISLGTCQTCDTCTAVIYTQMTVT